MENKREPQNLEEVTRDVREIAWLEAQLDQVDQAAKELIARMNAPLVARLVELREGVESFATSNRAELTAGGKTKTVKLPGGGKLYWKDSEEVEFDRDEDAIVKDLRTKPSWRKFLNIKIVRTVNKTAVKKWPSITEKVNGLLVKRVEKFYIQP